MTKKIKDFGKSPRFEKKEIDVDDEKALYKYVFLMECITFASYFIVSTLFNNLVGFVAVVLTGLAFMFFFIFCRDNGDGGDDDDYDLDDFEGGLPVSEEEKEYLEIILNTR